MNRRRKPLLAGHVNVLPKALTTSREFRALGGSATKLLIAILPQFNGPGSNNGSMRILVNEPARYGFTRKGTLLKARDDLLKAGFLIMTRLGGQHRPTLYGVTWERLDPVDDMCPHAQNSPPGLWRAENAGLRDVLARGNAKGKRRKSKIEVREADVKPPEMGTESGHLNAQMGTESGHLEMKKQAHKKNADVRKPCLDSWLPCTQELGKGKADTIGRLGPGPGARPSC